jgi:hypothetical protein
MNLGTTTDAQETLITDLADVTDHVAYEFDADEYEGVGTCGFAHVSGLNGNRSFVRRVKSAADNEAIDHVEHGRNDGYRIDLGGLELSLRKDSYRGGYRLSIINVGDFRPGPEHQRMDVRERLHRLVLNRLQYHGYAGDARVRSRMD